MKAINTVMSKEQIAEYMNTPQAHVGGDDCYWDLDGIVKQQAEISFKAGIREAGLQLRARISGIDEEEGLREFRKMTLQGIGDLLKEWGVEKVKA